MASAAYQLQLFLTNRSNSFGAMKCFYWQLTLVLVLLVNGALSGQIVKHLPGFDGELPFRLETGYISVGESELFYYFIESQGNPEEDPLFLWLNGGPGCSSFNGLIYEIGPLEFDIDDYKGGLPRLRNYPSSWTQTANVIFLDAPVGTGFSYAKTPNGWPTSDTKSAEQSYQFLRKWLLDNPKYQLLELFIGGDAYSGIVVPLITHKVIEGNEAMVHPYMNLKGYLLGSPRTDAIIDENSKIKFAYMMALIPEQLYKKLKRSCNESYVKVDPSNAQCLNSLSYYQECVKDLYANDILEPNCLYTSSRSLNENSGNVLLQPTIPELWCRNFNYSLSYIWANDPAVQEALHIRKGTVSYWERCNQSLAYTKDVLSVVNVHRYLSTKSLIALVESGDRDMVVPFVGTEKWIKLLNLTISDYWRPWLVEGQVAGYTTQFHQVGYYLTFATVKGGGHPAPAYYRERCYEMFQRWVHYYPL